MKPLACANCGAALLGPWCHACGQSARTVHRSARKFAAEFFAEFLDADGRVWSTLRRLVVDPGGLTRAYLAGKRASQAPPLRLYLAMMLLAFTAGSVVHALAPDHALIKMNAAIEDPSARPVAVDTGWPAADRWLTQRVAAARAHRDAFNAASDRRLEQLPLILLPFTAAVLGALFALDRRFVMFDHVIVALHALTALAILLVALQVASLAVGDWAGLALLALPVWLFRQMCGVYGTSLAGTAVRVTVLIAVASVLALLAATAISLIGLATVADP